jgi:hypothetical protein
LPATGTGSGTSAQSLDSASRRAGTRVDDSSYHPHLHRKRWRMSQGRTADGAGNDHSDARRITGGLRACAEEIMDRSSADDFLARLGRAVRTDAADEVPAIFAEYCTFTGHQQSADGILREDGVFEGLLRLMRDESFARMSKSSAVMSIWEYEWGTLGQNQRARLLEVIEEVIPRVADDVTAFIASELLGEYYDRLQAVPVILAFAASEADVARVYVPHAIAHLLQRTDDVAVREQLIQCLHAMRDDASDDVREEVNAAIRALPKILGNPDEDPGTGG